MGHLSDGSAYPSAELGTYPLMDTTEARYGEMARLMIETNNWITPQFDYGVPFWGKPPLFTWMSAVGIETFGVNEFAVRVPHWIAGILTIMAMALFARRFNFSGMITALVLATCGIFAVSSGAVMTDMALTLGMTLAMTGFYLAWKGNKAFGYLGFFGLAIGLLAKGPLVIVLLGLAVGPWLILQHGFKNAFVVLWQRFPIIGGTLMMLAIALPWYFLAEQATPGFIDYFIVGEHFKRFLVSGWEGDLYGSAHDEVRGTIWLFWVSSAAPWSLVLPVLMWLKRGSLKATATDGLFTFLLFWLVSPMVLFTFAGNILPAYVLPGIPALALLITMLVSEEDTDKKWFQITAAIIPFALVVTAVVLNLGVGDKRSEKSLLAKVNPKIETFYVGKRPFSGQFYSAGQAKLFGETTDLDQYKTVQLVGRKDAVDEVISDRRMNCVIEYTAKSKRSLYKCDNSS
ncbi:hypothetical protein JCM19236_3769 [Vibrio sp. JCM 19236]|nr:hypothetical protein JCM19236_3769 [Vibrio sp. JCM 19236]